MTLAYRGYMRSDLNPTKSKLRAELKTAEQLKIPVRIQRRMGWARR